jgi:hypothetical protein
MTQDISLAGSQRSPSQGKGKKIIMTTNYGQAATQDRLDPMVEAVFKEMMQTGTYSTATARREDAALAQVLLESLKNTISQASPYERALFVATLAPALAEALAPLFAQALAPALLSALSNMAASNKTGQESASGDGSDRQEGQ